MPSSNSTSRPSDEADERQLAMAQEEGAAYQRSLAYMVEEVADSGGRRLVGDYIIAFAQERAEGMYQLKAEGQLEWMEPGDANCHLEVSVSDAADQRFVPALDIEATLIPAEGAPVGPFKVPFVWHPGLYHYGANVRVPGDGRYTLRIRAAPPTFMRHDRVNGRRYADTVEVEFKDVKIETGRE
ncbi:MAG TPA: iron transporter [Geminicoccaceae bacterium]|nr:iron transporter [Geminicoccaceae bacterium]